MNDFEFVNGGGEKDSNRAGLVIIIGFIFNAYDEEKK